MILKTYRGLVQFLSQHVKVLLFSLHTKPGILIVESMSKTNQTATTTALKLLN